MAELKNKAVNLEVLKEAYKDLDTKKANKTNISVPYKFRGNCTFASLPTSGNEINDTFYVTDEKCKYSWNGTNWYQSSLNETDYLDEFNTFKGEVNNEVSDFKSEVNNSVDELKGDIADVDGCFYFVQLFDKSSATTGYYIDSLGVKTPNTNWCYCFVNVKSGDNISMCGGRYMWTFWNDDSFISNGGDRSYGIVITVPDNVNKIGISTQISNIDNIMVSKSDVIIEEVLPYNKILKFDHSSFYNIVMVGKGLKYEKIQDAVDSIESGTILVFSGVYEESVDIRGKKINLVGVDRDTCIVKNNIGDYDHPPLNMSGDNNHVRGFTFDSYSQNGEHPSYAVHIDHVGNGGGTSILRDCNCISYQNAGIGIGTCNSQHIIIDNCYVESTLMYSLYAHNYQLSGASNQKLTIKNCEIRTKAGRAALSVHDSNHESGGASDNTDTIHTYINNVIYSDVYGMANMLSRTQDTPSGNLSGLIKLSNHSFGNSLASLNTN